MTASPTASASASASASTSAPALAVSGLHKAFGGVRAVDDVTFVLAPGERLALIGPNGAGKSTLFNMLNGQIRPDAGRVRLFGRDITGLPPRRIWRLGVGRTFQITATFASMTVIENVRLALMSDQGRIWSVWRRADRLATGAARDLLARVGLADQAERAAAMLAYGDLKRLELAIALAHRPRLLLMDEPTAGMAPGERDHLMRLTMAVAAEDGAAVLFTEHDMDVVFTHAARILVLDRGGLVADGPPDAVRSDPQVRAVYLGTDSGPDGPDTGVTEGAP